MLCFNPLNSHKLCMKELTVQDTSKRSCIRSSLLCGTNWACEDPHVDPSHIPPPPPYLSPAPCQGYKRIGVGGGGAAVGHLLPPGLRPHSLTALTLHICQCQPVISDGSPFYREHAPVGALETETSPPLEQQSLGGGGGDSRRGARLGGGVGARKASVA